ncbi:hypothetical protein AQ505_17825 [Pedobacter sp. PACM 27299]|uniref:hypothetical protein n=1 Tax=Pedobacter sp. PACM 27299 TaxID=1727164 RepID=UPI000705BA70|nr:hypothetical protein [Pedobacter sp. PACM 27299]ALL07182.1 hypothetical protein AQ505_17825 [Pedobacter sp. PACM 27299]
MGVKKHLLDVEVKLSGGRIVKGPVTTSDDKTYHFKSQSGGSGFYLYLIKDDNGWYESGGNEAEHPQEIVDQVGLQIDTHLKENQKSL